ncbi:Rv3654c family TadE-like protein [Brevibacterium album]|uniref:Rv3654c family TadE-like protein n=1 Tax=Brevibacterium album TaxID=417948 RepID=UPI000416EC26|nr:Rv3654c family TadE-like protein [Brevibacterium album]
MDRTATAGPGAEAEGRRCDEGSSTVIGLGTASLAMTLVLVVGAVSMGLRARSQADAAADLAALAAAQTLAWSGPGDGGTTEGGTADPCAMAEEVAERNGAELSECIVRPDLQRAKVEVEVPVALSAPGLERRPVMRAEAVAGRSGP